MLSIRLTIGIPFLARAAGQCARGHRVQRIPPVRGTRRHGSSNRAAQQEQGDETRHLPPPPVLQFTSHWSRNRLSARRRAIAMPHGPSVYASAAVYRRPLVVPTRTDRRHRLEEGRPAAKKVLFAFICVLLRTSAPFPLRQRAHIPSLAYCLAPCDPDAGAARRAHNQCRPLRFPRDFKARVRVTVRNAPGTGHTVRLGSRSVVMCNPCAFVSSIAQGGLRKTSRWGN
jgi:hypothetical protein